VWFNFANNTNDGRGGRSKNVFARLHAGVMVAQANDEMRAIAKRLATMYPDDNRGETVEVDAVSDIVYGPVRRPLYLLLGASALVLLIACANLSNLLLARGMSRGREIAVRSALGAGRGRIARQLLTESLLLSLAGSACGLVLAWLASRLLAGLGPAVFQDRPPQIDGRVIAFTIGASLLTTFLFGLAPTLRLSRRGAGDALQDGGARVTRGRSGRIRAALALAQLSLAVVLLSASALVLKSFARVLRIEPGVNGENVLTASVTLPRSRYDSLRSTLFYERLQSEVRAAPGVVNVAMTSLVPFSGDFDRVSISKIGGRPEAGGADAPEGDRYVVSPSYFATMGVNLVRGRLLSPEDRFDAPVVCVVDEEFARHTFAGADPIGQTMHVPQRAEFARIVGVVKHVKTYGLDVNSPGQIYLSNAQYPWRWMSILIRTTGDPTSFVPTLMRTVKRLDADQPLADVSTMKRQMADLLRSRQFTLLLLGTFAGVAIALASIGLYGVIAYGVSQRRRELGVRLALGAQRGQIATMILSEGARIALGGAVLGGIGALAAGRLLSSLLFEVNPRDPFVLGGVGVLLVAVAIAASVLPARRATRVSAAEVMRGD
jgi:putative ABC transport system permease protein